MVHLGYDLVYQCRYKVIHTFFENMLFGSNAVSVAVMLC